MGILFSRSSLNGFVAKATTNGCG